MEAQDKQRDSTKLKIVDAAIEAFASKGYHETTMDEIAELSALSKGALYFHFPSKQDLFMLLADRAAEMLIGRMEEAMQSAGPSRRRKMRAAIWTAFDLFERYQSMTRLVFLKMASLGPPFDRKLIEIHGRIARLIGAELKQARDEGTIAVANTDLVSLMWVGALHEVLLWWLNQPSRSSLKDDFPELYTTLLRSIGLAAEAEDR
jgi:AcrR family transcriptional regulator